MIKKLFTPPSAVTLAQRELEHAKRELLAIRANAEHAAKMVEYYDGIVKRLTTYISTENVSI